jgi:sulfonate transport system substrate-binding protein
MKKTRMTKWLLRSSVVPLTVAVLASGLRADDAIVKATAVAPRLPSNARVAHVQLGDVTAIAARKGWLQEEFAKYNAKVDLVSTTSYGTSGTVAALFDRGDLHIGGPGMLNGPLVQRLQGLDVVLFWEGTNVHPRRAVTMVLADSKIHSVADLKGQTLGSSRLTCPFYAAAESLRTQGITVDDEWQKGDMRFVNLSGTAAVSALLAGRFHAFAAHPASSTGGVASLYIQNQVREVAVAVPNGVYVTSGGRGDFYGPRKWINENPDLARAFLVAWDRTVRWLYADHGAHLDEAATIAARELRVSKSVELFALKDESEVAFNWGITDYKDAVDSIRRYLKYQIASRDPFYTKHQMTDKELEAFVDPRFFAGGEYFVDTSEKRRGVTTTGTSSTSRSPENVAQGIR